MSVDETGRIVVTGATGFIGRHCLPILTSGGFDVHAVDIRTPDEKPHGVHWHHVDLLDVKQSQALFDSIRPTHLLHFAWYAKPNEYWNSLENIRWVEGSLHLLRIFRQCGGHRAVVAGTCAEYDWRFGYCAECVTPLAPSTLYGKCKNALQQLLEGFSQSTGLSSAWGRIFFLYGPHENPDRLVSSVILNLLKRNPAQCTHGNQIRDFLYVEDVALAFVALLKSNAQGAVNIASGCPASLREVVLAAADRLDARDLVNFGAIPAGENEPPLIVGDNRRLVHEVGWKQSYDLTAGMEQTVNFWREICAHQSK